MFVIKLVMSSFRCVDSLGTTHRFGGIHLDAMAKSKPVGRWSIARFASVIVRWRWDSFE